MVKPNSHKSRGCKELMPLNKINKPVIAKFENGKMIIITNPDKA